MKRLALLLVPAYPFVVWFALERWSSRGVALLALAVLALRAATMREALAAAAESRVALGAVVALCVAAALFDWQPLLLAVPVVASGFAALLFGRSLASVPLVERFARADHPELISELTGYCRTVTRVWFVFLVANAAVALGLALFAPLATWALYTGLISYLLMGLLFAAEWLVRQGRLRAARLALGVRAGAGG
jgi:uncharacterized membrane protein